MENTYGIGVKNRYELFYDEDVDPLEILRQQEEEKERRKTDKAHKDKKIVKGVKQSSTNVAKKSKDAAPVSVSKPVDIPESLNRARSRTFGEKSKPAAFDEQKDSEERKNFGNYNDQYFPTETNSTFTVRNSALKRGNQERGDRGRGGFRGRGRGRARGFATFEGRPRREFDRHSGSGKTGIRHVDKRDGAGSNNWGDVKDEFDGNRHVEKRNIQGTWEEPTESFDQSDDKRESTLTDSWNDKEDLEMPTPTHSEPAEKIGDGPVDVSTESKENEPVVEGDPTEDNVKEMTLDEWKREQEGKRSFPKYNLRKPGEGEDNTQWKKLYMLKKKAKDEDDDEEEDEDDADDEEFGRRGRQRQLVDIPINFSDSRRNRGRGRGGRGSGARGGNSSISSGGLAAVGSGGREAVVGTGIGSGRNVSRSTPKIKSPQQSAPKVDDWNDFPSLVTA